MSEQVIEVLWADDDSRSLLAPLKRRLARHNLDVVRATNYAQALALLKERNFPALLVDIILPRADDRVGLSAYRGLDLARDAAELGVLYITFLTVVQPSEVDTEFERLKADYKKKKVKFSYFDKTQLLEPGTRDRIARSLKP
ncbi:MAG TPA: response regulator [Pyrinomonadaceae bacterium]|nr:response regulator [Pyrinomonadaceae bacterium]